MMMMLMMMIMMTYRDNLLPFRFTCIVFLPVYSDRDGRSLVPWCRGLDTSRLLIAEALIRPQASECGIYCAQNSTRAGLSPQYFACFSVNIIPAVLRTHSFICH